MQRNISTILLFWVLLTFPVFAEEVELELKLGLVKIMRAGQVMIFSEKGYCENCDFAKLFKRNRSFQWRFHLKSLKTALKKQ